MNGADCMVTELRGTESAMTPLIVIVVMVGDAKRRTCSSGGL